MCEKNIWWEKVNANRTMKNGAFSDKSAPEKCSPASGNSAPENARVDEHQRPPVKVPRNSLEHSHYQIPGQGLDEQSLQALTY
jgi:hypothetical protein